MARLDIWLVPTKTLMVHVTWPHPFQEWFVIRGLPCVVERQRTEWNRDMSIFPDTRHKSVTIATFRSFSEPSQLESIFWSPTYFNPLYLFVERLAKINPSTKVETEETCVFWHVCTHQLMQINHKISGVTLPNFTNFLAEVGESSRMVTQQSAQPYSHPL